MAGVKTCLFNFQAVMSLMLCVGCTELVRFRVLDGESMKPVPNATVSLVYDPLTFMASRSETTGEDGIASIWASLSKNPDVRVIAAGYLNRSPTVLGPSDINHGEVVLWLFAEPVPDVVLMVSKGFRGSFTVEEQVIPVVLPQNAGRRSFKFAVSEGCVISFTGIPTGRPAGSNNFMAGRNVGDFRAVYDDGSPLLGVGPKVYDVQGNPRPLPEDSDVAVRWISQDFSSSGSVFILRWTYILGTAADARSARRERSPLLLRIPSTER
jgi:hypothetical protein